MIHVAEVTQLTLHLLEQQPSTLRDLWCQFYARHQHVRDLRILAGDMSAEGVTLALYPWTADSGQFPSRDLKTIRLSLADPKDGLVDQAELLSILSRRHRDRLTVERLRMQAEQPGLDESLEAQLRDHCGTVLEFGELIDRQAEE